MKVQDLEPDKEITIEGCNMIEIENDIYSYEINFWYSQTDKK